MKLALRQASETAVFELCKHHTFRMAVDIMQWESAWCCTQLDTLLVDIQAGLVKITLRLSKLSTDGPSTRNIRTVAAVPAASIYQNHVTIMKQVVVACVMDGQSVRTTGNNRQIRRLFTASHAELIVQKRLQLALGAETRGVSLVVCCARQFCCNTEVVNLSFTLDQPGLFNQSNGRFVLLTACLLEKFYQRVFYHVLAMRFEKGWESVASFCGESVHVNGLCVLQKQLNLWIDLAKWIGAVSVEHFDRTIGAGSSSIPQLGLVILARHKENAFHVVLIFAVKH